MGPYVHLVNFTNKSDLVLTHFERHLLPSRLVVSGRLGLVSLRSNFRHFKEHETFWERFSGLSQSLKCQWRLLSWEWVIPFIKILLYLSQAVLRIRN